MTVAVLDTNVLASGFTGFSHAASTPGAILRAWSAGHFQLMLSEHIFSELDSTFQKSYFAVRIKRRQVNDALALLRRRSSVTSITVDVCGIAKEPADDLILATAISGKADYLVTGDTELQKLGAYQEVRIVSPREFLEILNSKTA